MEKEGVFPVAASLMKPGLLLLAILSCALWFEVIFPTASWTCNHDDWEGLGDGQFFSGFLT